ncbi:MAG: CPBP family intramembrane metalloprotease [Deltaproteobacteria bacterium]|nr:CPBP family intramembrane metalloprotease [Deltaproteobacteria bacterium]
MSQKIKSSLEVLAGIIFIFGYLWLIYPLHSQWIKVFSAIPILLFLIYSDFNNKKSFKDLGFRLDNWHGSFKILLIFTSITIPVLYVIWQFYFPVNNLFYKDHSFWRNLVTYPFGVLCQQYLFLAFFFRRYRNIFSPHTNIAIFFSALTFSVIHIPTPPLIIFCFVAGIVWAGTYNKYPNLFTITISHSVLGIFCASILLVYQTVGPSADIGRWCQNQDSVYGFIDNVNYIKPYKNDHVLDVNISHEKNSIFVEGWVASTNKIKNIRISLGGKDYSVHYGDKREDVATHFNNPDFSHSGFNARIPISDFALGYHKLLLKVYLEGELFYHSPGAKIWVELI